MLKHIHPFGWCWRPVWAFWLHFSPLPSSHRSKVTQLPRASLLVRSGLKNRCQKTSPHFIFFFFFFDDVREEKKNNVNGKTSESKWFWSCQKFFFWEQTQLLYLTWSQSSFKNLRRNSFISIPCEWHVLDSAPITPAGVEAGSPAAHSLCTSPAPSSQWPQKVLTLITVQKITLKHSSINSSVLLTVNRDIWGEASCPREAQWHEQLENSRDDGFQSCSQTTWPPSLCIKTLLWPVNGTVQSAGV